MSYVTDVVVAAGFDNQSDQARRLGRLMMESQYWDWQKERVTGLGSDDYYAPLPNRVGAVYLAGGQKIAGGSVWWLGLNYADMDRLVEMVSREKEFAGVVIWYQNEEGDQATVIIGKGVVG